jgi:DNA-binding response OmpR family regulator
MQKRILLVEDDKDFSEALQIILKTEGFDVFHSKGIAHARRHVRDGDFDVVILDYHLSDGQGTSIIQHLQKHQRTRNIPVIIMSADSSVEGSALRSGARWFMPKPIDFNLLFRRIRSL